LEAFNPEDMLTGIMIYKDDSVAKTMLLEESWWVVVFFWDVPEDWIGPKPHIQFLLELEKGINPWVVDV
jgi:hypothetical protein